MTPKEDIPEDLRIQKINELKELEEQKNPSNKNDNNNNARTNRDTKVARKYRMVKFFEKRKLMRYIERINLKLEKVLDKESEEAENLRRSLQQYERDMIYVKYYPKDCKYISLFKNSELPTNKKLIEKMREQAEQIAAFEKDKIQRRKNNKNKNDNKDGDDEDDQNESDDQSDDDDDDDDDEKEDSDEDDFFLQILTNRGKDANNK